MDVLTREEGIIRFNSSFKAFTTIEVGYQTRKITSAEKVPYVTNTTPRLRPTS